MKNKIKESLAEKKYLINLVLGQQGKYSDWHFGWFETKFLVIKAIICIILDLYKDDPSSYDSVVQGFAYGESHHGFNPDYGDYTMFDYFDIGHGYFSNWFYIAGEDSSI